MSYTGNDNLSVADIRDMLAGDAAALAEYFYGKPTSRTRSELRFGDTSGDRKRHLVVYVQKGIFVNYKSGASGNMLALIRDHYGCSFKDAIGHAKTWLRIEDDKPLPIPRRRPVVPDIDEHEIKRSKEALRIWNAGKAIVGTPGETYLKSRAIDAADWPYTIRWHPQGFLIFASIAKGEITQIQRIYINPDGTPKLDEDGRKIKRSLGPGNGGSVRFGGSRDALCLAEGPETGLSVWHATGIETWVSLGGIRADLSDVPIERTIIVCKDDDPRAAPSIKGLRNRIKEWRREGRTVLDYLPFDRSRRNKADFNDALQEHGPEYVRNRLIPSNVIPFPDQMDLGETRRRLSRETRISLRHLTSWDGETDPPVHCLKVGLGVGKTEAAIHGVIRHVQDGHGAATYAVPTHDLSGDLLERFHDALRSEGVTAITVAVWKGREWKPRDADDSERMCQNYEVVREVQRVGGDPQTSVCYREEEDGTVHKCPFYDDCKYQEQRRQSADIWITAHQSLFSEKPEPISKPSLIVIDESFYQAGLRGVDGHPVVVSEDMIEAPVLSGIGGIGMSADLDAGLGSSRRKLAEAIRAHTEPGPIRRDQLIEAGLTEEECRAASRGEWLRKVEVNIYPGMAAEPFKEMISQARVNSEIPRMSRMWKELAAVITEGGPSLSGRLSLEDIEDKKSDTTYRGIRMTWISDIGESWKAPVLHIDATMRMDIVRAYFPQAEMRGEAEAKAPHHHTIQYFDKTFAKSSILHGDAQIEKLWTWCRSTAIQEGGNWLVVVQKDVEEQIRERFTVPDFIDLAHHNAVAGIDRWRDVTGQIIVGRTQPPPNATARIAGALTGEHVALLEDWYPSSTTTIQAANGQRATVDTDRHPHDFAEEIRASICEDQLLQISGRGRGVNRSAADPLTTIILGNVPFIDVDELRPWEGPGIQDQMLAEAGVVFGNGIHAAKAIPGLGHPEAVRKRLLRDEKRSGTFSYKIYPIGKCPTLLRATYLKSGPGQRRYSVLYDVRMVSNIEAWLTARLGPLNECLEDGAPCVASSVKIAPHEDKALPSESSGQGFESRRGHHLRPSGYEPDELPVINAEAAFEEWDGGVMPAPIVSELRHLIHDLGWSLDRIAGTVGISRPHLSNALLGRFGLRSEAATRIKGFLRSPPSIAQQSLFP